MFRQALIVGLALGFSLSGSQNVFAAKKVAFLVGVNKYLKNEFRDLSYAERDVTEVAKELRKQGFETTVVLGKQATKANLDRTILNLIKPLGKEDTILVMLTGHGIQKTKGDAYYCPYDALSQDTTTLFSLGVLIDKTLAPNVGRKFLLIDACRNDPDPSRGKSAGIQGKRITLPEDTAVIFSCKSGQQSFENDQIKHGVFTYCVLDALRGSAANAGEVSWSDLEGYVKRKMASNDIKKLIPAFRRQTPIDAGGVEYTVIARVEISKPKVTVKPVPKMKPEVPKPEVSKPKIPVADGKKPTLLVSPFSKKQADAKQAEWATYLKKETTITNSVGMKFNLIPPGEFKMGRSKSVEDLVKLEVSDSSKDLILKHLGKELGQTMVKDLTRTTVEQIEDEIPHKVRLTKPYYFGTTEVTRKQWKSVMGTEPWRLHYYQIVIGELEGKGERDPMSDEYPVTSVSWEDAQKFIEKLNQKEGGKYRLPTEAEWEYACRAGSESMYCFGDSLETLKSYAWIDPNTKDVNERYAHRVGLKLPNNFGLFDVHGNVYEWCSDFYSKDYYKNSPLIDPLGVGKAASGNRVLRGGSWDNHFMNVRSADRYNRTPTYLYLNVGFRLSRTP